MEELSPREHLVLKNYLSNGGNKKQALLDAGFKDGAYMSSEPYKFFNKPSIKIALEKINRDNQNDLSSIYLKAFQTLSDLMQREGSPRIKFESAKEVLRLFDKYNGL